MRSPGPASGPPPGLPPSLSLQAVGPGVVTKTLSTGKVGVFMPPGSMMGTLRAPPRPVFGRAAFFVATMHKLTAPDLRARHMFGQVNSPPDVGAYMLRMDQGPTQDTGTVAMYYLDFAPVLCPPLGPAIVWL